MIKTNIGTEDDGSLRHHYAHPFVVQTGPIVGSVTTAEGRVVDVSDKFAAAESEAEAVEIAHLISVRYETEGHPEDSEYTYDRSATPERLLAVSS